MSAPNLTAILAGLALAELALYRVAARVFLPLHPQAWRDRFLLFLAHYLHVLVGLVALVVLALGLSRAFRRRDVLPRSMRAAAVVISIGLLGLGAAGIVLREIPERLVTHLGTSHAFLAWFLAMGALRGDGPRGPRVAVMLFALPVVLETLASFAARLGAPAATPADLSRAGDLAILVAAGISPWLLARHAWGGVRVFFAGAGVVVVVGALTLAFARWFDLVHTVLLYGFHLDLPPPGTRAGFSYAALTVAAAAGGVFSAALTLATPGPLRLCGLGLVLLATSGHKALAPAQILMASCGLLALAFGARMFARASLATGDAGVSSPAAEAEAPTPAR